MKKVPLPIYVKGTDLFNTLGHNFIIGGDINSKHIRCGCRVTYRREEVHFFYNITSKNV